MTADRHGHTARRALASVCCVLVAYFGALLHAGASDAILVVDGSRSMWGQISGRAKISMVHQAFKRALEADRDTAPAFGVLAFGTTAPSRCTDISVLHKPGTANAESALAAIEKLRPWGLAPIEGALLKAARSVLQSSSRQRIILIADGTENCGGDPCTVARALKTRYAKILVDVIALGVAEEDEPALSCISEATGGQFFRASNQKTLNEAAAQVIDRLEVPEEQTVVAEAAEDADDEQSVPEPLSPASEFLANPPLPREHPNALSRKMATLKPRSKPTPQVPPITMPAEEELLIAEREENTPPTAPMAVSEAPAKAEREPEADTITTGSVPEAVATRNESEPDNAAPTDDVPPAQDKPAEVAKTEPTAEPDAVPQEQGVRLRAKLTAQMRHIGKPLEWSVYRVGSGDESLWPQVAAVRSPQPTVELDPGRYLVRARYGHVSVSRVVVVGKGKLSDETFVLNAGGLKILSHLVFVDTPEGTATTHFVYTGATDENGMRKLVAKSKKQGQILRLNAGRYRVISRLGNANAVVSADVEVSPGVLTAVEVNHKAGVLNLTIEPGQGASATAGTNAVVFDEEGKLVLRTRGETATAILAPGTYTVSAEQDGTKATGTFEIHIGETKLVNLKPK